MAETKKYWLRYQELEGDQVAVLMHLELTDAEKVKIEAGLTVLEEAGYITRVETYHDAGPFFLPYFEEYVPPTFDLFEGFVHSWELGTNVLEPEFEFDWQAGAIKS